MWTKPGWRALLVVGLAALAASGAARTHRRNADWRDRATLLRADLASLPQNAKLHYNLGNFLRETEQQESAIKHYKEALRLWPTYASAHNNIGTLVNGSENAEHHFLQAIRYNKYHVNAHYNLGKLYKKTGRTEQAVKMLERCISLHPRFVQAHVELLSLKPELEKMNILKTLVDLEPNNWEHYILYGNWWRSRGLPAAASKYYLEATRLSFQSRPHAPRADLLAFRGAALTYRALGQRSRVLQLLTRWHTWRRGWPSAASHLYWRDWSLKMELEGRVQIYTKAVNPTKSTTCLDHKQLVVEAIKEEIPKVKTRGEHLSESAKTKGSCEFKSCVKKRNVSIATQLKTTHNKSETGLKKKCTHRDRKKDDILPKLGQYGEHILMKTF